MSQSNAIAGALALAFILFITLRGELPSYLDLFKPRARSSTASKDTNKDSSLTDQIKNKVTSNLLQDAIYSISHYYDSGNSDGGQLGDGSTQSI